MYTERDEKKYLQCLIYLDHTLSPENYHNLLMFEWFILYNVVNKIEQTSSVFQILRNLYGNHSKKNGAVEDIDKIQKTVRVHQETSEKLVSEVNLQVMYVHS